MSTRQAERDMLNSCGPELREVGLALVQLVSTEIPSAVCAWDGKNLGYGTAPGYKGLVFVLSPQRRWINLGITNAAGMNDPSGLLEGAGKRHRHVKVRTVDEAQSENLALLVRSVTAARLEG